VGPTNWQTLNHLFQTTWTTIDPASNATGENDFIKKNQPTKKYANAHCTHLPLAPNAQVNYKPKSKECIRQRFVFPCQKSILFCYFAE
jgi:hypothetical protein